MTMTNYPKILLGIILLMPFELTACQPRKGGLDTGATSSAATSQQPKPISSDDTLYDPNKTDAIDTDLKIPGDPSTDPNVDPSVTSVSCLDSSGQVIAGQFTDQSFNTSATVADCYDSQGTLVYQGSVPTHNCYQELTAQFGQNVQNIYGPAQSLLPNLYAQAQAQGAQGEQALISALSSGTCAQLKAQGG
jgi:hypothetical protein